MKKIGYIGFGELGSQLSEMIFPNKSEVEEFYFDDILYQQQKSAAYPFNHYSQEQFKELDFYICLGYKHLTKKLEIALQMLKLGRRLPSFVHPTSFVAPSAQLAAGTIVYPMCNIDKGVKIGIGVLLNNTVTISHDCTIENACYLAPGVTLSGFVKIGNCCFLGTSTSVSNNLEIGSEVKVGIGTVVTKNLPDNCSAIGYPMSTKSSFNLK